MKITPKDTQFSSYLKNFSIKCLFTWLHWVLVAACDLVPRPGIEPGPPALGARSLAIGLPQKSPGHKFFEKAIFLLLVVRNLNDNQRNCIWRLGMLNQNAPRKFHIAGEHGVAQRMTGISSLMCPRMIPCFCWAASCQAPSLQLCSFTTVDLHGCRLSKESETFPAAKRFRVCVCVCVCVCACSIMSDSLQASGLYGLPGSSVHGILQARILEWVAISDKYWKSSLSPSCPQQSDSSLWKQQTLPLPRFSSRDTWTNKDVWSISFCPKVPVVSFDHTDVSALRLFFTLLFFPSS